MTLSEGRVHVARIGAADSPPIVRPSPAESFMQAAWHSSWCVRHVDKPVCGVSSVDVHGGDTDARHVPAADHTATAAAGGGVVHHPQPPTSSRFVVCDRYILRFDACGGSHLDGVEQQHWRRLDELLPGASSSASVSTGDVAEPSVQAAHNKGLANDRADEQQRGSAVGLLPALLRTSPSWQPTLLDFCHYAFAWRQVLTIIHHFHSDGSVSAAFPIVATDLRHPLSLATARRVLHPSFEVHHHAGRPLDVDPVTTSVESSASGGEAATSSIPPPLPPCFIGSRPALRGGAAASSCCLDEGAASSRRYEACLGAWRRPPGRFEDRVKGDAWYERQAASVTAAAAAADAMGVPHPMWPFASQHARDPPCLVRLCDGGVRGLGPLDFGTDSVGGLPSNCDAVRTLTIIRLDDAALAEEHAALKALAERITWALWSVGVDEANDGSTSFSSGSTAAVHERPPIPSVVARFVIVHPCAMSQPSHFAMVISMRAGGYDDVTTNSRLEAEAEAKAGAHNLRNSRKYQPLYLMDAAVHWLKAIGARQVHIYDWERARLNHAAGAAGRPVGQRQTWTWWIKASKWKGIVYAPSTRTLPDGATTRKIWRTFGGSRRWLTMSVCHTLAIIDSDTFSSAALRRRSFSADGELGVAMAPEVGSKGERATRSRPIISADFGAVVAQLRCTRRATSSSACFAQVASLPLDIWLTYIFPCFSVTACMRALSGLNRVCRHAFRDVISASRCHLYSAALQCVVLAAPWEKNTTSLGAAASTHLDLTVATGRHPSSSSSSAPTTTRLYDDDDPPIEDADLPPDAATAAGVDGNIEDRLGVVRLPAMLALAALERKAEWLTAGGAPRYTCVGHGAPGVVWEMSQAEWLSFSLTFENCMGDTYVLYTVSSVLAGSWTTSQFEANSCWQEVTRDWSGRHEVTCVKEYLSLKRNDELLVFVTTADHR